MKDKKTKEYWENKYVELRGKEALTPVESGFPITSISLDLTNRCSLRCDYCFTHLTEGDYEKKDLSIEKAKKVVDWLFDDSTSGKDQKLSLTFWGGEPLLKFDLIKEIVKYGDKKSKETGKQISYNGTTNVVNLTEEKFDFLDKHNIHFLLSIDGRKEMHDLHRVFPDGTGSFNVIEKNAEKILERWPRTAVRLSFSVDNIEDFDKDVKFLYDKGFRDINYSPVCEGDWTEEKLSAIYSSWKEISKWWKELKDKPRIKFINDYCSRVLNNGSDNVPCGAGRGYIGITVDGAIYPCHRFHKFTSDKPWHKQSVCLGHIDHGGILNQEWRENFINWDTKKDMNEGCNNCVAKERKLCSGGCWATNWDIGGSLNGMVNASCESTIANIKIADELLEDKKVRSMFTRKKSNRTSKLPHSQGCKCYNTQDILYGRKTINKNDEASCLCNMTTYGSGYDPNSVDRCTCYNVEDSRMTHYDQSGKKCGRFDASRKKRDFKVKLDIKKELNDEEFLEEVKKLDSIKELSKEDLDRFNKIAKKYNA